MGLLKGTRPGALRDPDQQASPSEGAEEEEADRSNPGLLRIPRKTGSPHRCAQKGCSAVPEGQDRPGTCRDLQVITEENHEDEDRKRVEKNPGMKKAFPVPGSHQAITPPPGDPGSAQNHRDDCEECGEPPRNPSKK